MSIKLHYKKLKYSRNSEEIRISWDLSATGTVWLSAGDGQIVPERTVTTAICTAHCTVSLLLRHAMPARHTVLICLSSRER